ncbi:MAG: GTP-binding protein [Gordonia sp. (in: high G+C Gram-positive bacteria)]|uniref:CobW family GTP-binding protein n=1 Tax=Gordonia sp. (in: high G+C Gram-positive bacteria) TaxID=84139 RepID=UPI0039E70C29
MTTVPVIVLAGFLGAGKTTLLNHVLREAGDARFGVIVNDFGTVNVDALLVAGQVDGVVGFGNGCLCCATDSDGFEDAVSTLVRTDLDAVLVEASGIAEPRSLVRRVVALDDDRAAYGGLVYVVDAAAFATGDLPDEALAQARDADLVVVNKADLVDAAALDRLRLRLDGINDSAPRVTTAEAAIDPALLVDARDRAAHAGPQQLTLDALLRDEEPAHDHGEVHLHDRYQQHTWENNGPVNPRALARLLERPPAGCYRLKGWAHVESEYYTGTLEFSAVGGRVRATRARRRGSAAENVVVLIGVGMDDADLDRALAELAEVEPDDEYGVLSLLRYDPVTVAGPADTD